MQKLLIQKKPREAMYAWGGLIAYVLAYDLWAMARNKRTLSQGFSSNLNNWPGKVALFTTWAIITKHLLFGKYFTRYEVIGWSATGFRKRVGAKEVKEWIMD